MVFIMHVVLLPLLTLLYCSFAESIPDGLSSNNNSPDLIAVAGQNPDISQNPVDLINSDYESISTVVETGSGYSENPTPEDLASTQPEKAVTGNKGCTDSENFPLGDEAFVDQETPADAARNIIIRGVGEVADNVKYCPDPNNNVQLAKPRRPNGPGVPILCLPDQYTLCCKPESRISSTGDTQSPRGFVQLSKLGKRQDNPKHAYADCVDCKFFS